MLFKVTYGLLFILTQFIHLDANLPLLFPPAAPTRTQWIIGVGIPLKNLPYEDLSTGYVLKAEYFLPETVEQLKQHSNLSIAGRNFNRNFTKLGRFLSNNHGNLIITNEILNRNTEHLSSYRWSIYKILEIIGKRMNLNGHQCLLKSICELCTLPFHYENGLFSELVHVLLRPSSSLDKLSSATDVEYVQAERYGNQGTDCHVIYKSCPKSLLEHFSYIHQMGKDIVNSFLFK